MNKQKLQKVINQKETELTKLKEELANIPEEDFETYIHNKKEFRIYKWTNPIKDFIYPKGFRMSEFQEFQELIESKKIKLEVWVSYFTKHFNKLQWNKEYCLSWCYLNGDSSLVSNYSDLAVSSDDGRVVCVRNLK